MMEYERIQWWNKEEYNDGIRNNTMMEWERTNFGMIKNTTMEWEKMQCWNKKECNDEIRKNIMME